MGRGSRKIVVRSLRARDHRAFVGLLRAAGMEPRTRGRDSRGNFTRQMKTHGRTYLGAFDRDRLVGVVLGTHDTRKGWVNRLAVHPDYRRKGIAARLVDECERRMRALGIVVFAALVEEDNRASKAFFESRGYEALRLWYMRKKRRPGV